MIDSNDFVTQVLPDVEPRWLALLKEAVANYGKRGAVTEAAKRMGVSRPYVARVLMTGESRIKEPSKKFIDRVIEAFGQGRVDCPHLSRDIALGQCKDFAALEWKVIRGTGHDKAMHWHACQHCPQNPQKNPAPEAA
jgi:hypothetical protein